MKLLKAIYNKLKNGIAACKAVPADKKRIALTKTLMFLSGWLTVNYCFG